MPDMLSNTSCFIALDNIGQLDLLHSLYDIIHISEEVAAEFGVLVPAWIKVHPVQDKTKLNILHNLIDLGEASTIALAYQFNDVTLILDDRKARKLADNLNLRFTGLLHDIGKPVSDLSILDREGNSQWQAGRPRPVDRQHKGFKGLALQGRPACGVEGRGAGNHRTAGEGQGTRHPAIPGHPGRHPD